MFREPFRSLSAVLPLALLAVAPSCATPPRRRPPAEGFGIELPAGELGLAPLPAGQPTPDFSPGWYHRDQLAAAISNSLSYLAAPSSKQYYPYGPITHERMVRSLQRFLEITETARSAEEFNRKLQDEFEVWVARGGNRRGDVLFTGYGTPILNGSLTPDERYRWPLYGPPDDLVKDEQGNILGRRNANGSVVPYYTRAELEANGHLAGKELVWIDDPFDAYIAHVQGSAIVRLPDGSKMEVGYAGKNGRDYVSIGKVLVDGGKIDKSRLSLAELRRYFQAHPEEVEPVLSQNPSFVFFQRSKGGPYGCLGRPVLPMRSVATDKEVFPRAGVVFCEVRLPEFDSEGALVQRPERFFALDQDRGGAIRSAGRCDVFMGVGNAAMERAGHVLALGRLYYLFLREDPLLG